MRLSHPLPFLLAVITLAAAAAPPAVAARGPELREPRPAPVEAVALPSPLTDQDFYDDGAPPPAKVELGRLLFFDKILSGNRNISCATCHHPLAATGDGLSLSIGEGGVGLGMTRALGQGAVAVHERVPRNAPPVFNLGARRFAVMFHDGRVELDPSQPRGVRSPAGSALPAGLDNVLAVQAMFPVTSAAEMAGSRGENSIADAAAAGNLAGPGGVWEQLADRLRAIPEYVELFRAAFPSIRSAQEIQYVDAANAIAAFESVFWRADDSPFDRYLRGERGAMSPEAVEGMRLFYGAGSCGRCHAGVLQTDLAFHSIALPQIGPGKGDGLDGLDDFGRERVTGRRADRCRFRTPSLRNVVLTGPWGHDGAYDDLGAMIDHHLDPVGALEAYDTTQAVLPQRPDLDAIDFAVHRDPVRRAAIASTCDLPPGSLDAAGKARLMAFLHALTSERSLDLRRDVPPRVPSGLPIAD
jgi:cytochrome c peroxidase